MTSLSESCWHVAGESVRGAAHVRSDLPNQDAIAWSDETRSALPIRLAVADGHGSRRSFRSDLGSAFAVNTRLKILADFDQWLPANPGADAIESNARRFLPRELEYHWKKQVLEHLTRHPFSNDETEALRLHLETEHGITPVMNPFLAYGTTALGLLATDRFFLYLQLGDGDILNVYSSGEVTRPLATDACLFGNQTTSLCQTNAAQHVRLCVIGPDEESPELVLLSTDGYANSFKNDNEFLRVGPDILEFIRVEGLESVKAQLAQWLEEASALGSGDDITLGLLSRPVVFDALATDSPENMTHTTASN